MTPLRRLRALSTDTHAWVVIAGLAITTWLHYATSPLLFELHTAYRYLYFLPVAYAALRFGLWGGLLSSAVASLLFAPHVWTKLGRFPQESLNDFLVAIILGAVGILTGLLADAERQQRRQQEATSAQLAASLAQLEQRTAALEEMQRYIGSVLASLSCGVVTLDADGCITTDNRAAVQLLGSSLVGQRLPPSIAGHPGLFPGNYFQIQLSNRPVGVHATALTDGNGRQLGTVVVLDDLTEVKMLEEQVRRAERLSALGTLAGGVAHEVRNPVGIIRASAQLLGSLPAIARDEESQEFLQVIAQETGRVDQLIEDLLDYARAGELNLGPVDLGDLVSSTAARLLALAEQAGINVSVDVEPGLPLLQGDGDKLEQALLNLGLNAIEALQANEVRSHDKGWLRFEVSRAQERLRCTVADNGPGMPETVRARIFDPFFTTRDQGTGLGLATVQRIIADHNGTVDVSSRSGQGATFTIWLPIS